VNITTSATDAVKFWKYKCKVFGRICKWLLSLYLGHKSSPPLFLFCYFDSNINKETCLHCRICGSNFDALITQS